MARLSMEEVKVLELITISGQKPEFCEIIDLIQTIKHQQQKIETQRQEIEKLKATLADWKYNAKCDADHIAALTTDKDELAKVLKKAREALYAARVDVLTKETDELARDAVEAIDALIGGKEDV